MRIPTTLLLSFLLLAAGALAFVLVSEECTAATITVDDDGTGDHTSIQAAIDNATEGDTVRVLAGLYNESIVVNKTLSLVGAGREQTTIHWNYSWESVEISADWVNFSGFKIVLSAHSSYMFSAALVVESNNSHIFENNCSGGKWGIAILGSRECVVENNICSSEMGGSDIYLGLSVDCTLRNNSMAGQGLSLSSILLGFLSIDDEPHYWNSHTITSSNTVNGKPVHYYRNATGFTVPSDAGQVILANCSKVTVKDLNCSDTEYGIFIAYSSEITVENNLCLGNWYGIVLQNSSQCRVAQNNCSAFFDGISLEASPNNTLTGNQGSGSNSAISLEDSPNSTIDGNNCQGGMFGISLRHCWDSTVTNNSCLSTSHSGIFLKASGRSRVADNRCENNGEGISIGNELGYPSGSCVIENNHCFDNQWGIELSYVDNCSTRNNVCSRNTQGGLYISGEDHLIENNSFLDNGNGIKLTRASHCSIINNSIRGNDVGIWLHYSYTNNSAHHNSIQGNKEYGISATEADSLLSDPDYFVATENFWGTDSGPYNPDRNSWGKGDRVSDDVVFSPWVDRDGALWYEADEPEEWDDLLLGVFVLLAVALLLLFTAYWFSQKQIKGM